MYWNFEFNSIMFISVFILVIKIENKTEVPYSIGNGGNGFIHVTHNTHLIKTLKEFLMIFKGV